MILYVTAVKAKIIRHCVIFILHYLFSKLMVHGGYVYIITNKNHTVFYTGVTSDLFARVVEHKEKIHPGSFTSRFNLDKLVYYECFFSIEEAIAREKVIKKYRRIKKINLIKTINPLWSDLFKQIKYW